jgi:TonB family protein
MNNKFYESALNPTVICIMVSIGLHGVLGISIPVLSRNSNNEKDFSKHSVGLLNLSPTEANRVQNYNPIALNPLPSLPNNNTLPSGNISPLPNVNNPNPNANNQSIPVFPNQPGVNLPFNLPPSPIGIVPLPDTNTLPIFTIPKVVDNNKNTKKPPKPKVQKNTDNSPQIGFTPVPPPANFPSVPPTFNDYQPGFNNNPNFPPSPPQNNNLEPRQSKPKKPLSNPTNITAFNNPVKTRNSLEPEFSDSPSTPLETPKTVETPPEQKPSTNPPNKPENEPKNTQKPSPNTPDRIVPIIKVNRDGTIATPRNTPNNNREIPTGLESNTTPPVINNGGVNDSQKVAVNSQNSGNNREDIKFNKTGTTNEEARKKYVEQLIKLRQNPTREKDRFISSVYPEKACSEKLQGVASLAVVVDTDGKIIGEPELIKSSGYKILNNQAIEQVKKRNFSNKTGQQKSYLVDVEFKYNEKICSKGVS